MLLEWLKTLTILNPNIHLNICQNIHLNRHTQKSTSWKQGLKNVYNRDCGSKGLQLHQHNPFTNAIFRNIKNRKQTRLKILIEKKKNKKKQNQILAELKNETKKKKKRVVNDTRRFKKINICRWSFLRHIFSETKQFKNKSEEKKRTDQNVVVDVTKRRVERIGRGLSSHY